MLSVLLSVGLRVLAYCFLLLAGVWCWFQWTRRDLIRAVSKLPCPLPRLPLLGHLHYTLFGLENFTRYILRMTREAVSSGMTTVCLWCGPMPLILVHGLDDIQKILTSSNTTEKGDEMAFLKFLAGEGLLTARGDIWKITRRYVNPLFHPRNVEEMTPSINQNSREMVTRLVRHVDKAPFDVLEYGTDCTLKTVCHLIFGKDQEVDVDSKEFHDIKSIVVWSTELFVKRMVAPWLRFDSIFEFLYKSEMKEIRQRWATFTATPLQNTKEKTAFKRSAGILKVEDENTISKSEGLLNLLDVFSVLQDKYPNFSDRELNHEMITFLATGTDSVGLAFSSCLLALAQYQDIQERVYKEIMTVVGPDDDITQEDLNRMPYLEQVFKETLRWFTIVPYIIRKPAEDLKLSNCTIPAGNSVIVCLLGAHMNPENFPDPLKFDPDRFSPENMAGRDKFSYIPFSAGPRNCIGKIYSYVLVKTMLVHVLRRFRFTTEMDIHNLKRKVVILLVNTEGYKVEIHNRIQ